MSQDVALIIWNTLFGRTFKKLVLKFTNLEGIWVFITLICKSIKGVDWAFTRFKFNAELRCCFKEKTVFKTSFEINLNLFTSV